MARDGGEQDAGRGPRLVDVLSGALRAATAAMTHELQAVGISLDQWRVLRRLDATRGRTMGQLSELLNLPPASTTRAVDGLVDVGLAYRGAADEDRRQVVVLVSAAGAEVAERLEESAAQAEAALARDDALGDLDAVVQALAARTR